MKIKTLLELDLLYSHILSHKHEEESLEETCWHMFPCFSLKHAVQVGGREFSKTVGVSPSF